MDANKIGNNMMREQIWGEYVTGGEWVLLCEGRAIEMVLWRPSL